MKKLITAVSLAAITTGCTSFKSQPLDLNTASSLKGQTVTYTIRKKPDFSAITAVNVQFGLLGALAAVSTGNEIVNKNNIEDPATSIASNLSKALQENKGLVLVESPLNTNFSKPNEIASSAKKTAKYVIDVQTINWSMGYFPTDWTHYRVFYTAKAQLISTENNKVLAEGFCKNIPESKDGAPNWDEITGNNAARIKSELSSYTSTCIDKLQKEMLAI